MGYTFPRITFAPQRIAAPPGSDLTKRWGSFQAKGTLRYWWRRRGPMASFKVHNRPNGPEAQKEAKESIASDSDKCDKSHVGALSKGGNKLAAPRRVVVPNGPRNPKYLVRSAGVATLCSDSALSCRFPQTLISLLMVSKHPLCVERLGPTMQ